MATYGDVQRTNNVECGIFIHEQINILAALVPRAHYTRTVGEASKERGRERDWK